MSREHYISESILKFLGVKKAQYSGPNKVPHEIPAEDMGFPILCRKHNNAMGFLDGAAKRVLRALVRFNRELDPVRVLGSRPFDKVISNGWHLERWMLKLFCGLKAAGHFTDPTPIRGYVLHALFNGVPLPQDMGLYMPLKLGQLLMVGKRFLAEQIVRRDTGETTSLVVSFGGVTFQTSVAPGIDGGTGKLDGLDRHIPGLVMNEQRKGYSRELELMW